jgi:hypothetical protein
MANPPPPWSSVLQDMIKSSAERQRLSTALGVTAMTLSRWSNGESKPQRPHLMQLVRVVHPNYRQALLDTLQGEYPDIHTWLTEDTSEQIPPEFFAQVLNIRTTTTESLRFWRITDAVLKQALALLDPNRLGMAVRLLQCMPPYPDRATGKVRSLREIAGKGTSPWTADLEHDVVFLGLESMSGYAVESRHVMNDDNLYQSKTFPAVQDQFEVSAAAHPVRFEGHIAGCLLASSVQTKYFSQQRQALLATFSDVIALAFDKEDFYAPYEIGLRFMPKPDIQRPYIATFRQRVTMRLQEAMEQGRQVSNAQIEREVWHELETELLDLDDSDNISDDHVNY